MESTSSRRWAPWWAYVAVAVILNYARQVVVPPSEVNLLVTVGLFIVAVLLSLVVVTIVFRMFAPEQDRDVPGGG